MCERCGYRLGDTGGGSRSDVTAAAAMPLKHPNKKKLDKASVRAPKKKESAKRSEEDRPSRAF